jgi:hypothetical protein
MRVASVVCRPWQPTSSLDALQMRVELESIVSKVVETVRVIRAGLIG